jgi:predicted RNA-binding Zn-ribbon protein involved in translation (DUF1610 family)
MEWVTRSFETAHITLQCDCGWAGPDAEAGWDVQVECDRVVRQCPGCGDSVPEWGTLTPLEGAARVARGRLSSALVDAGVVDG